MRQIPSRTLLVLCSVGLCGLLVWTAGLGITQPGIYERFASPEYVQESVGQDWVTLVFGVPLILLGGWLWIRNTVAGPAILAGGLAFELYVYAIYLLGGVLTDLFFVYIVIAALCLYSLVGVLSTAPRPQVKSRWPANVLAGFFALVVAMFSVIWIGELSQSIAVGEVAPGHLIFVIDLVIVLPAFLICAAFLLMRRAFAGVLAGVLLIKLASLCLSILLGQALRATSGLTTETMLSVIFTVLAGLTTVALWIWYRSLGLE